MVFAVAPIVFEAEVDPQPLTLWGETLAIIKSSNVYEYGVEVN